MYKQGSSQRSLNLIFSDTDLGQRSLSKIFSDTGSSQRSAGGSDRTESQQETMSEAGSESTSTAGSQKSKSKRKKKKDFIKRNKEVRFTLIPVHGNLVVY